MNEQHRHSRGQIIYPRQSQTDLHGLDGGDGGADCDGAAGGGDGVVRRQQLRLLLRDQPLPLRLRKRRGGAVRECLSFDMFFHSVFQGRPRPNCQCYTCDRFWLQTSSSALSSGPGSAPTSPAPPPPSGTEGSAGVTAARPSKYRDLRSVSISIND